MIISPLVDYSLVSDCGERVSIECIEHHSLSHYNRVSTNCLLVVKYNIIFLF